MRFSGVFISHFAIKIPDICEYAYISAVNNYQTRNTNENSNRNVLYMNKGDVRLVYMECCGLSIFII